MKETSNALVLASFSADALALGAHWVYNTAKIESTFGRIENFRKPPEDSYHPTKGVGEFTHYGDQTLVLLESIASCSGFDIRDFAGRWQRLFENYNGYFDHATRQTLANFAGGLPPERSGSNSSELSAAARIAPLIYWYQDDPGALMHAVRAQAAMTHNVPLVVQSAEFFAHAALEILKGSKPAAALEKLSETIFKKDPFAKMVRSGMESIGMETAAAIAEFGQTCGVPAAFPCVVHLVAKYEDDLEAALVENVMAGGDSAARGLLTGMILGAHLGPDAIPPRWLSDLKAFRTIVDLMAGR